MSHGRAWLGYALVRLGPVGVVTLCLLVVALALVAVDAMWRARHEADRLQVQTMMDELRRTGPVATAAPSGTGAFIDALPRLEDVPGFVETLHRQAALAGLTIERAEYRTPPLASGDVLRSQVVLPLRGTYPDIVGWLFGLLRAYPSAALDELAMQRESPGSARLRARIVLSHYSRSRP